MNEVSIDVNNLESLPAATALAFIKVRQKISKHLERFANTLKDYAPLMRELEQQEIEIRFDLNYGTIDFGFDGTPERLSIVFRILRRHGYEPDQRPKADNPDYSTFWRLENDPERHYATLFMRFSSTLCLRVQIGTTMVEQPVYEVRCGNSAAIENIGDLITRG
jgi:hypothetical protein